MAKNVLLLVASTLVSGLVAFAVLHFAFPQVLENLKHKKPVGDDVTFKDFDAVAGYVKDAGAFYDTMLSESLGVHQEGFLYDNATFVRGKPFAEGRWGAVQWQMDALGFRNDSVPRQADIICLGDSQTWGVNAQYYENWPSQMKDILRQSHWDDVSLYNMSLGGWCPLQFQYLLPLVTRFKPKYVVVAIYTGNDLYEANRLSKQDRYRSFRPAGAAEPSGPKKPLNGDQDIEVTVAGKKWQFQPAMRLSVNDTSDPEIAAGLGVIESCLKTIGAFGKETGIPIVYVQIPTKEYVYYPLIQASKESASLPETFHQLIQAEGANFDTILNAIHASGPAEVVDVREALRAAAASNADIYLPSADGHPTPAGYTVIAKEVAAAIARMRGLTVTGSNLLRYGDFEAWNGGIPDGWKVGGESNRISPDRSSNSGRYCVRIDTRNGDGIVTMNEVFPLAATHLPATFTASAKVRTWETPGACTLLLFWTENGAPKTVRRESVASEGWQPLSITVRVPANVEALGVQILSRLGGGDYILVDSVTLNASVAP